MVITPQEFLLHNCLINQHSSNNRLPSRINDQYLNQGCVPFVADPAHKSHSRAIIQLAGERDDSALGTWRFALAGRSVTQSKLFHIIWECPRFKTYDL